MTTLPTDTAARDPDGPVDHDVVVVGGGAAGCSAAVFLARAGLETLVCDGGASAIRQCARIENYLGFPELEPERFLALGRAHAEREGATVFEERVTAIERHDTVDGGFRVETTADDYVAARVLVATAYDGEPLVPLADELGAMPPTSHEEAEAMDDPFLPTDAGRTPVEGLYGAGWMTSDTVHQVQTNAGDGARAALALIRDQIADRYWPAVADRYADWVVHESRYGGEEWADGIEAWVRSDLSPPEDLDDEAVAAAAEDLEAEYLDKRLTDAPEPVDRAGQRAVLEHLDDDVVRAYAASLDDPTSPSDDPTPESDDPTPDTDDV